MIEWYKKVVFENYANFNGRARRSEYWYYSLMNFIICMGFLAVAAIVYLLTVDPTITLIFVFVMYGLYALATFIPNLAVAVRRLHDVGKSGWFYFVGLIPVIGGFWLLFLFVSDSESHTNQYGPNPKNISGEINDIGASEIL